MKEINIKLFWTPLFLFVIMLNSCSIDSNVKQIKEHIVIHKGINDDK